MDHTNENPLDQSACGHTAGGDPYTVGEAMLSRAKDVAQRITERVRRLADDTGQNHASLPTEEQPPLG